MNDKAGRITFFLLMIFFSGAISLIESDFFLFLTALIIFYFCIIKGCTINYPFLLSAILFFILITIITDFIFPAPADLKVVMGTLIRILLALSAASLLGYRFFAYYYDFIYKLSLISFPCYLIQNVYPQVFTRSLLPLAKILTTDLRFGLKIYCYGIHNFHVNSPFRNSGFMWEPGAFGMAIGLALFYGLTVSNFRLDKKLLTMLAAGLTTFSTTFYLSLAILFTYYFINKYKSNIRRMIILAIASWLFIFAFNSLSFMSGKVERDLEGYRYYTHGGKLERMTALGGKAGRIISVAANWRSFLRYPFGHGDNMSFQTKNALGEIIGGANGVGPFMVRYGIIGIIFLLWSLNKTCIHFRRDFNARFTQLYIFLILIYLFSNPIYRNPFFFTLLFLPFSVRHSYGVEEKAIGSIQSRTTKCI